MERHWEQGSANKAHMRQVWGKEVRKKSGGKQNTVSTGEQEVEGDNKTQEDVELKDKGENN